MAAGLPQFFKLVLDALAGLTSTSVTVTALPAVVPVHSYDTFALAVPYAVGLLEADAGDGAVVVPAAAFLSTLTLEVDTIVGLATTLTWYLAHDAAGKIPITPPKTITLATYVSVTAAFYVFAESLEVEYQRTGGAGPFLCAHLDVGTAVIVGRLYHRVGVGA